MIFCRYNIRPNKVLFQWLNTNVRLCSSSDSSSDSDSDTEKIKQKKTSIKSTKPTSDNKTNLGSFLNNMIQDKTLIKVAKNTSTISSTKVVQEEENTKAAIGSTDLTEFVNNMLKTRKLEKTIDVAIQPRKSKPKKVKPMSYEKKLVSAAESVADKLGGDKAKTMMDLLQKIVPNKDEAEKKDKQLTKNTDSTKSDADLMKFINDRKAKQFAKSKQQLEYEGQKDSTSKKHLKQKSVIQDLLQEYNKQTEARNISQQLLKHAKTSENQFAEKQQSNMKPFTRQILHIWNGVSSQAFKQMNDVSPNMPELKTWAALEQKELKAITTYSPANIFQEMILWTEQGKLWNFPIDNEQGMEEEHNIHFSEHVFTERHLKGWCPTSGPIRHFMELVCVGLSKNPYMTVQEKINHIMWYKDYFKSKEALLQELRAIKEPFPDAHIIKQTTQ
ncbi:28S ribosomal protein S31, mitochondrial [Harpegnathos saltator]|uniref:Small ribosomal subunit protein mS31 n=1 Tax=Harpegnathos saltator TaxID=610380 RepID=E2C1W9_HARSA|nr:28S ribosomal protein S31, mitochondrial [Harpegnathos saltator]